LLKDLISNRPSQREAYSIGVEAYIYFPTVFGVLEGGRTARSPLHMSRQAPLLRLLTPNSMGKKYAK
jgi:hypothetical protein